MERNDRHTFGSRLKQVRKDRKLRQRDLAESLGVAQTTIANYEQGTRFPDEGVLWRIAEILDVSLDFLLGRADTPTGMTKEPGTSLHPPAELSPLAQSYLTALLEQDRHGAAAVLDEAEAAGLGIREIYLSVFEPSLKEIGHLWERGEVDVYEEHFFSAATGLFMAGYSSRMEDVATGPVFLGMAVGGEFHELGTRMVGDFLQLDGWRTRHLGVNVPTESVLRAVVELRADLVGIGATMAHHANGVSALIQALRSRPGTKSVPILVGGAAFNGDTGLWKEIGADGYAPDAAAAVYKARELIHTQKVL